MDNPEKLAIMGTQDEDIKKTINKKQNTTQKANTMSNTNHTKNRE